MPLGFGWKPIPSAARVTRDEVSGIRKVRESCLEDSTTLMCSLAFASLATCNKQIQLHQYFVKLLHQFNFLWLQFVCFDFLWTALLCSSEQELQLFHINSHISDSFLLKNKMLKCNSTLPPRGSYRFDNQEFIDGGIMGGIRVELRVVPP